MIKKEFKSLSEKEYRAYDLESYSSLKYLLSSVSAFIRAEETPFTGNEYTLLGTAIHNYLQGCKNLVKFEPYIKCEIDSEDLIVVPQSFKEKLDSILENLRNHAEVRSILESPTVKFEVPYLGKFKSLEFKSKLDIVVNLQRVGEIKTSSKANSLEIFRKEAYERHYDLQAAMYLKSSGAKEHFFIVVNTVYPYSVEYYPTSQIFINSGKVKLEKIERIYRENLGRDKEKTTKIEV